MLEPIPARVSRVKLPHLKSTTVLLVVARSGEATHREGETENQSQVRKSSIHQSHPVKAPHHIKPSRTSLQMM